ncbi:metallophosphoesterase [Ruminococcaceae bacterium OttesenSCG-928-I18]|nr:metallophosphoesterase [Ruminococcaceae bacterium OttesenSCG-928-I18]
MKLLVFADTHHSTRRMLQAAMKEREADACIHLGDGVADADALQTLFSPSAIYRVQGNCDYDSSDFEDRLVSFDHTLFFITHGHHYGVKYGLEQLWQAARESEAKVALYGHTHMPHYEYTRGIHLFNPGSLNMPRGKAGPTYGIITLEAGQMPKFDVVHYKV